MTGNILMPSLHVTFTFIICNLSKLQTVLPGYLLQCRHTWGWGGLVPQLVYDLVN